MDRLANIGLAFFFALPFGMLGIVKPVEQVVGFLGVVCLVQAQVLRLVRGRFFALGNQQFALSDQVGKTLEVM
jgi:hypothetical protein